MNSLTATTTLTTTITTTAPVLPAAGERSRGTVLCLIVHDELELRLRLAGLVRRAMPKIDADTVTRAGFDAISIERLRAYVAVMFIVEFSPPDAAVGSLASLKRLHEQAPSLPIFVFARGGNERSAARAMKLGASDYWPIHSVIVGELCSALQPLIEPPAAPAGAASSAAADRWRQPEIAGYTMMKKIAQSTVASVYLARNDEFPQPVALKIEQIKGQKVVSAADRERFTKECEILSKLNHRSDRECARLRHHGRLFVPGAGIFSLRQPARAAEASGERSRCRELRASNRRGAADRACRARRAPRPEALESHAHQ